MIKLIHNSFSFEDPTISILHPGDIPFTKMASEMTDYIKGIKPEKNKTKVIILALGAFECYGGNRNGDAFEETQLKKRHHTFVDHGHLYKHHVNKDPNKSYGGIDKSIYNPRMKRVELLATIDNCKAPDIVQKLESNMDVPVSMACRVPYDICSICGKKSKSVSQYCDHLKNEMTKIYPDGRQVLAMNPNPTFFDLSFVFRPADRIAYVLKKVASFGVVPSAVLANEEGLSELDYMDKSEAPMQKLSLLRKLSDIEKEVEGIIGKLHPETNREKLILEDAPKALTGDDSIVLDLNEKDPKKLLGGLARCGVIVKPRTFVKILTKKDGDLSPYLPGIFSKLLDLPGLLQSSVFDFSPFDTFSLTRPLKDRLLSDLSLFSSPSARRMLKVTIVKPSRPQMEVFPGGYSISDSSGFGGAVIKSSSVQDGETLALAYAMYKLGALSIINERDDLLAPVLATVQNYIKS